VPSATRKQLKELQDISRVAGTSAPGDSLIRLMKVENPASPIAAGRP
jgi:hypothetical protein